ncbi:MAG: hypothetical protein KF850_39505 [Labilithrix sp.]|nr:hypothetical protein [Labilithrix sp.]MBX3218160.1 hypothetical protein [Labilithrix sp.]
MGKQYTALGWIAIGLVTFACVSSAGCGTDAPSEDARGLDGTTPVSGPPTDDAPSAGGDGDRGAGGPTGEVDAPAPTPEPPGCGKNVYTEPLPTAASLDGLSFSRETAGQYLLAALEKRYPIGKAIVEGGIASPRSTPTGNCVDIFLGNKSSAAGVLRGASTTVHECGHFYDMGKATRGEAAYVIRPDLAFTCSSGDTTSRGGKTFARSVITRDAHARKRTPCGGGAKGCDSYANTYLSGQSGAQGYNSVLEEATQYVNSLATALAFKEQYARSNASERDGILTFLWYIERYLATARAAYPEAYDVILEDPCWRRATLAIWDRGWFYLRATKDVPGLGLDDDAIEALVNEPELLAEIDALRSRECE